MPLIDPGQVPKDQLVRCLGRCKRMMPAHAFDLVKKDGKTSRFCQDCRDLAYHKRFSMFSERWVVHPWCEKHSIPKTLWPPAWMDVPQWRLYTAGFMRAVGRFAKTLKMRQKAWDIHRDLGHVWAPAAKSRITHLTESDPLIANDGKKGTAYELGYWHGVMLFCPDEEGRQVALAKYLGLGGERREYGTRGDGDSSGVGGLLGGRGVERGGASELDRGGGGASGPDDRGGAAEVEQDDGSDGIGSPS